MDKCIIPGCGGESEGKIIDCKLGLALLKIISNNKNNGSGDGLTAKIGDRTSARVHPSCRKRYTRHHDRPSHKTPKQAENDENCPPAPKKMRSSSIAFDQKEQCFYCGKALSCQYGNKTPVSQRDRVCTLTKKEAVQTLVLKTSNGNDQCSDVHRRLCSVLDPLGTLKYHRKCYFSFTGGDTKMSRGKPVDMKRRSAFQDLCDSLEEDQECQFSVQELSDRLNKLTNSEMAYSPQYLKELLKSHFQNRVVFTDFDGKNSVFCFRKKSDQFVYDKWLSSRKIEDDDSIRIVKAAAKILREKIRSEPFDMDSYIIGGSLNDKFLVPDMLRVFLRDLMSSRETTVQLERTLETLAQALIQTCRPRSYISPILLHVAVYLHQKVDSKLAIDVLHNLGLCSSYGETRRLVISLLNSAEPENKVIAGFIQFAWDNADHQTKTLTGHGTFHNMGGIQCTTPKSEDQPTIKVPRMKGKLTVDVSKGRAPILPYAKPANVGLKTLTIEHVNVQRMTNAMLKAMRKDLVWISGCCLPSRLDRPLTAILGYSGFMEIAHTLSGPCDVSGVDVLPFINLDPTDRSCVYSALSFARSQCDEQRQKSCIATLDLPLYMKAVDITLASEELEGVIVILGGFHMAMSFLGCIGAVYAGSGLDDLFSTVYAKNSVPHIMGGHAYARSVRANGLAQHAIGKLILQEIISANPEMGDKIALLYEEIMQKNQPLENLMSSSTLDSLLNLFTEKCAQLSEKDRTSKLWVEYFRMMEVFRLFTQSLRTGDWELYLDSMRAMLPYFHAANHLPYARGTHIYLQQMERLETMMDPMDFEMYTKRGFFVVRHTDRFFKCVPMDYTIETKLMRHLKTCGLTRGRGISESTIAQFVAAFPLLVPMNSHLEEFCGVRSQTSEQHVELRPSRQARDKRHLDKYDEWLAAHPPFAERPADMLVSLSTGAVADSTINCDQAWEIGLKSVREIEEKGGNFADLKLTKKNKVKSFITMSHNITLGGEEVTISPYQLLHRIVCALDADNGKLVDFLEYELAPRPPSLFDEVSMRKTEKAALAATISTKCPPVDQVPHGAKFVVDGGMLLRAIVWPRPATYSEVCLAYRDYALKRYKADATIVFDGYEGAELTTKAEEQRRRSTGKTSPKIMNLQPHQYTCTAQANFLGNGENKTSLIRMMTPSFESSGMTVIQDEGDADQLVVATALRLASSGSTVVVSANDTDIFAMLIQRCPERSKVHLLMPGVGGKASKVFNIKDVQKSLLGIREAMLLTHAFSGCDTTSAFYGKGKLSLLALLEKHPEMLQEVMLFNQPNADEKRLVELGEKIIINLYNGAKHDNLKDVRYALYVKKVNNKNSKEEMKLKALPPTSPSAREHTLRVYHQVQSWHGRKLDPTKFGWEKKYNRLVPVTSKQPPAPERLLKLVSCGCTKGCNASCSCRRAGIPCRSYCSGCQGECINCPTVDMEDNSDDENVDDPQM